MLIIDHHIITIVVTCGPPSPVSFAKYPRNEESSQVPWSITRALTNSQE